VGGPGRRDRGRARRRGRPHRPCRAHRRPARGQRRLAAANLDAIRRADAVLALLDGADVDSGVAAEIGYAAALGTPVVGFRLDFRTAGDNEGGTVNLQVEHLLAAPVADTLEDALGALTRVLADRK
jgi:nucleoside 2-deoxyribosyltransferase